jgi:hypothetical protein
MLGMRTQLALVFNDLKEMFAVCPPSGGSNWTFDERTGLVTQFKESPTN